MGNKVKNPPMHDVHRGMESSYAFCFLDTSILMTNRVAIVMTIPIAREMTQFLMNAAIRKQTKEMIATVIA